MKTLYYFILICILASAAGGNAQTTASYNDVLLIVNDSSRNSVDIGNFFAQRRHIPAKNIFHIAIDTSKIYNPNYGADHGETIDSATFKQKVWFPLEDYMRANDLIASINYIVTTKGCPLRVTTSDPGDDPNQQWFSGLASFNDCLALINGSDSTMVLTRKKSIFVGVVSSPYYGDTTHFKHEQDAMPYYLTTRLDAYTVDQVKSYIMKAESTAVVGQGQFVLDVDPERDGTPQQPSGYKVGNDWLRDAAGILNADYMNVFLDTTDIYVTDQKNVIGYCSWGSNDGNSGNYTTNAIPHNTYLNGAIGETYVSTGGRSFNPGTSYGQSLIADWIAEGISGIKGYTDEPYLTVMAEPDILFPQYLNGFNMAESYWSASPLIGWRQVVIGDPKMMLKQALTAASQSITLPDTERYIPETMQFTIHNTAGFSFPLHKPFMDTSGDVLQFSVAASNGATFPYQFAAGDSLSLTVTFKANAFGLAFGTIDIPFRLPGNNHDNVYSVQVSAKGLRPKMSVPDTLYFPTTLPRDTSIMSFTISNNSIADSVLISQINFSLSSGGTAFYLQNLEENNPDTLLAGKTHTVYILFIPPDSNEHTSALHIFSNAGKIPSLPTIVTMIGNQHASAVTEPTAVAPENISLAQNYPNPFSQSTGLSYYIPQGARMDRVSLKVFDVLGRQVADLTPFVTTAGNGHILFNASALAEGTYFCRLNDGQTVRSVAMLHVK